MLDDQRMVGEDETAIIESCTKEEANQTGQGAQRGSTMPTSHRHETNEAGEPQDDQLQDNDENLVNYLKQEDLLIEDDDIEFEECDENDQQDFVALSPQDIEVIQELYEDPIVVCVLSGYLTEEFNRLNISSCTLVDIQQSLDFMPKLHFKRFEEYHERYVKFIQLLLYSQLVMHIKSDRFV